MTRQEVSGLSGVESDDVRHPLTEVAMLCLARAVR
jgi:hypothetical protein